ncbi:Hypothetical predicted protein [Podarcis lilfordi]|uniref:Uncharacterized protein n=1 Tax=Podarcis lilfordi TaxID=74358 RepID=A0AA35KNY6_9SAUR|nr:Hypothetical predicted protein [Podarcis lilfordi]
MYVLFKIPLFVSFKIISAVVPSIGSILFCTYTDRVAFVQKVDTQQALCSLLGTAALRSTTPPLPIQSVSSSCKRPFCLWGAVSLLSLPTPLVLLVEWASTVPLSPF